MEISTALKNHARGESGRFIPSQDSLTACAQVTLPLEGMATGTRVRTMTTGRIFDIQRFSIHDGPDIRTTVFLKGCPLRCLWCGNPESIPPGPSLSYSPERCIACGACVPVCPEKALAPGPDGKVGLDRQRCTCCGRCAPECDPKALEIVGREATVREVRCPMIPQHKARREHLDGIVSLVRSLPKIERVELLPYYDLWRAKLGRLGLVSPLPESVKPPDRATVKSWEEYRRARGVKVIG